MSGLARAAEWAERISQRLSRWLTAIAAVCVAAIVLVLVVASTQRYVLSTPIAATEEIAAYLFVALSFAALVGGFVERRHIRLLPLWQRLPARLQNAMLLLGHLAAVGVLALVIRETFDFAWSSYRFGTRSYVADLLEWPWMMIIPASLTLLAIALLLRAVIDLARLAGGQAAPEARSADPADGEGV